MRPRFRTITLEANNDPSLNPNTALEFKGYKRLKILKYGGRSSQVSFKLATATYYTTTTFHLQIVQTHPEVKLC